MDVEVRGSESGKGAVGLGGCAREIVRYGAWE